MVETSQYVASRMQSVTEAYELIRDDYSSLMLFFENIGFSREEVETQWVDGDTTSRNVFAHNVCGRLAHMMKTNGTLVGDVK